MILQRRPHRRSLARLLAVLAAVCATALLLAAPASAHTMLVSADPANGAVLPAAPAEVRLTFNEPVRPTADGLRLDDADGQTFELTAQGTGEVIRVDLPEALMTGTYLLSWRVVSDDGHPLTGTLSFSIGHAGETVVRTAPEPPSQSTPRLRSVVQGAHYIALLLAGGLVAFSLMLPRTAPAPTARRLRRIVVGSAVIAASSALALVPLSGAVKLDRGFPAVATADAWDPGLVDRELLGASLVLVGLLLAAVALRREGAAPRRLALGGASVAVVAPSLVGHTRSVDPELLMAADAVHLTAGAIWFGGLVGLALTLRTLNRTEAAAVISRFSTAAAASLIALLLMGSVLTWRVLGSWADLVHTAYGGLLLVKVALVAGAVAIAVVNRYVLMPRVCGADRRGDASRATVVIRRAVVAQGAMLAVALLTTGFLVDQSPHPQLPHAHAAAP